MVVALLIVLAAIREKNYENFDRLTLQNARVALFNNLFMSHTLNFVFHYFHCMVP